MPQLHETQMGKRFIEGTMPRIANALEKLVVSLEKPDCTEINLVKVKEEMEKREFKYDEENLDGWTNCLVDVLEDLYDIETKLAKVFKS